MEISSLIVLRTYPRRRNLEDKKKRKQIRNLVLHKRFRWPENNLYPIKIQDELDGVKVSSREYYTRAVWNRFSLVKVWARSLIMEQVRTSKAIDPTSVCKRLCKQLFNLSNHAHLKCEISRPNQSKLFVRVKSTPNCSKSIFLVPILTLAAYILGYIRSISS
jgi:hypothetical protein